MDIYQTTGDRGAFSGSYEAAGIQGSGCVRASADESNNDYMTAWAFQILGKYRSFSEFDLYQLILPN